MNVAIVGATGLVGQEMVKVLAERKVKIDNLIPVASSKSIGQIIPFGDKNYTIVSIEEALQQKPDVALFSAGSDISRQYAPEFEKVGTIVIDNSSEWRMDPTKKLIVPEINGNILRIDDRIIANPNCSTIQMVLALAPLHKKFQIKRIVVSTYQSVTGTGKGAIKQLEEEAQNGIATHKVYPHPIHLNVIPQVDIFLENDYTKEEMKLVNETKKILDDPSIQVTATCVRLPIMGGHAEAVNVSFYKDFEIQEIKNILAQTQGIKVLDNPAESLYPMPLTAHGKDEVYVGRIRKDDTQANTLNMWIVADNLRKGAATNTVQIAEYLAQESLIF